MIHKKDMWVDYDEEADDLAELGGSREVLAGTLASKIIQ